MKDRITTILEHWFIQEPALFQVLCTHDITANPAMDCPVRSGRRKVEYNPSWVAGMSDAALEEALRTEAVRILLKHPYERKPDGCCQQAIAIGSNLVVGDNYSFGSLRMETPEDYDLEKGRPYEWYSRKIQEMIPPEGSGGEGSDDGDDAAHEAHDCSSGDKGKGDRLRDNASMNRALSELWDEDELAVAMVNGIIDGCHDWGSLGGNFVEQLKASTRARINWRNILHGFRASILSSRRRLTRMRPNRRYGFEQMGSKREYDTRLLVAVDVSGSISSESLSYFYGVINSAFRHGFEAVDVIQFDCGVRVVQSLRKVMRDVAVLGRGGTSFQEPVDYAHENGYDGLLILTDGYAPEPLIPDNMGCKIIWVCQDRASYEKCHGWMEKSGRVCTIELS